MKGVPCLLRDVDSEGVGEETEEGEGLLLRRCYQAATAHFTSIFSPKWKHLYGLC